MNEKFLKTHKIKVPKKNETNHIWIDSKNEVLVFWRDNTLNIINSICPHMGAQLFYDQKEDLIKCPWHGLSAEPENCKTRHKRFKSFYKWKVIRVDKNYAFFTRS